MNLLGLQTIGFCIVFHAITFRSHSRARFCHKDVLIFMIDVSGMKELLNAMTVRRISMKSTAAKDVFKHMCEKAWAHKGAPHKQWLIACL